jgi:hypothetical protein
VHGWATRIFEIGVPNVREPNDDDSELCLSENR